MKGGDGGERVLTWFDYLKLEARANKSNWPCSGPKRRRTGGQVAEVEEAERAACM